MAWNPLGQSKQNIPTKAPANIFGAGATSLIPKAYADARNLPAAPTSYNAYNDIQAGFKSGGLTGGKVLGDSISTPPTSGYQPGQNGYVNTNTGSDPFAGASSAAQSQSDAELQSALSTLDYNKENLNNQMGYLGTQKSNSLSELDTAFTGVENQVKNQKTASETNRDNAISQAGSVAQSTQLQNRNILRALGILNSTAGGDLLSKPINEFDKQRATLVAGHIQRINELDDALNQTSSQHANAVKSLEDNYSNLVGQIQSDLRFNDRQRVDAVKSANAALQQRLSEIQTSLFNYKTQVDAAKATAGQAITKIANYTLPTANTGAISSTLANPGADKTSSNATIYGTDQKKKLTGDYSQSLSSGLLSGLA